MERLVARARLAEGRRRRRRRAAAAAAHAAAAAAEGGVRGGGPAVGAGAGAARGACGEDVLGREIVGARAPAGAALPPPTLRASAASETRPSWFDSASARTYSLTTASSDAYEPDSKRRTATCAWLLSLHACMSASCFVGSTGCGSRPPRGCAAAAG